MICVKLALPITENRPSRTGPESVIPPLAREGWEGEKKKGLQKEATSSEGEEETDFFQKPPPPPGKGGKKLGALKVIRFPSSRGSCQKKEREVPERQRGHKGGKGKKTGSRRGSPRGEMRKNSAETLSIPEHGEKKEEWG